MNKNLHLKSRSTNIQEIPLWLYLWSSDLLSFLKSIDFDPLILSNHFFTYLGTFWTKCVYYYG